MIFFSQLTLEMEALKKQTAETVRKAKDKIQRNVYVFIKRNLVKKVKRKSAVPKFRSIEYFCIGIFEGGAF